MFRAVVYKWCVGKVLKVIQADLNLYIVKSITYVWNEDLCSRHESDVKKQLWHGIFDGRRTERYGHSHKINASQSKDICVILLKACVNQMRHLDNCIWVSKWTVPRDTVYWSGRGMGKATQRPYITDRQIKAAAAYHWFLPPHEFVPASDIITSTNSHRRPKNRIIIRRLYREMFIFINANFNPKPLILT